MRCSERLHFQQLDPVADRLGFKRLNHRTTHAGSMEFTINNYQMDFRDMRKMSVNQRESNDFPRVVPNRPGFFGARGLDVLRVGFRLPKPLGNG